VGGPSGARGVPGGGAQRETRSRKKIAIRVRGEKGEMFSLGQLIARTGTGEGVETFN